MVHLPRHILGGDWLLHNYVDDINSVKISSMAEKIFLIIVMVNFINNELETIIIPTRKGPRCLTNIPLRIVPNPHGKKFHDLSGEILIRGTFDVYSSIKE